MRRLACVGRGAAFRGLPRKQAPEGPQPGRRFESRSQAPRGAWSTGAWAVAVPVLPGCPATGPLTRTGLDLAGTCPCGGTPLVAAREMAGAEQRRSRMVDGAATRRPPAHVPRCRGAGTQIAGRVLAERPLSDYPTGVRRAPATPSPLLAEGHCPEGDDTPERIRPREGEAVSCAHLPCHCRIQPDNPCHDGAETLPAEPTLCSPMPRCEGNHTGRPGGQGKPRKTG
jgi:hypothetical protein